MSSAKVNHSATHVIFDLDGTLLDTEGIYEDALQAVCVFYKRDVQKSVVRLAVNSRVEEGCRMIIDTFRINADLEIFIRKFRSELEKLLPQSKLTSGATKLVYHLEKFKIPMGLVCSSDKEIFHLKIKRHSEFFKRFSPIVLASDPFVKNLKPMPDLYQVCCRRFPKKPQPNFCLVIEDTPTGVQAALAAHMQVVLVTVKYLATRASDDATMVVTNLKNIDLNAFALPPLHE